MKTCRVTYSVLAMMFALAGCVREEEALLDSQSPPIGNGGTLAITAPAAMSSEAMGPLTVLEIGQATASGGDGTYTFSNDAPAGGFGLGVSVVNWTVQDGAGASASASQNITVSDTLPPTVIKPADMQVVSTGTLTMVNIGTATATDLVDGDPAISNDMPAAGFPMGTTAVTWMATDDSGNTATATQMVTVSTQTGGPLTIQAPSNISQEATAPLSVIVLGAATVTGGEAPMMISNDAPANGFPVGQSTVTWTVTDNAMTTATATQQVAVIDSIAPQLSVPSDITTSQGPELGNTTVDLGTATATDAADSNPAITNDAPANGFDVGTTTVTWTATDASGNTTTATQAVTVNAYVAEQCSSLLSDFQNTIYPIMNTANPPRCVGCHTGTANPVGTDNNFAFLNDPPTAADLEVFRTVALIDSGTESLLTVKALGGENHGGGNLFPNAANDPDFVELYDFVSRARSCITGLQLIAPTPAVAEATGALTTVDIGQATANGGDGSYTFSNDAPAGGYALGTTVVTWTVQDGAGATDTATQDVTVSDTTAPTITVPPNVQVDSTGTLTIVDIGTATASDLVDGNPTISNDMPAAGFPEGITTVTWTATDSDGNSATATQMVTVSAPTNGQLAITPPASISQEATAPLSAVALGMPTVTGGVAPVMISSDAPANGFPVGQTTVNWAATDSESTTVTTTQQVAIVDTTAPQITVPGNITADQGPELGNTNVDLGAASASDIVDLNPAISNDAPANGFGVGMTTVTWTATDNSGNTTTATQTVNISAYVAEQCSALLSDFQNTIYPIMNTANPPRCVGCHTGTNDPDDTPNNFAFLTDPPTAADLDVFRTVALMDSGAESLLTVKARGGDDHSGGDRFPDGLNDPDFVELSDFVSRARNCITELQVIAPAAISTEATGSATTVDIGQATANGGDGTYSFSNDAPVGGFALGTTVVNWTVQDGAGASDSATQDILVSDTTAPTITVPASVQADSTGTLTMLDIGTATATDLVDGNPTITSDMPAAGFPEGVTVVTWTATDASGNAATATQTVTVSAPSNAPLAIAAPANVSQEATAPLSAVSLGAPTVTGGVAPVTISNDAPANGFAVGQTTVNWAATDNESTTVTATQQVTISDTTAPQLTVPADIIADQSPTLGNTNVQLGVASANDLVDPNPAISNNAPANGYPVGTTTVTWTAQDTNGNSSTAAQTVTINAYVAELCSSLVSDFQNTVYPIMNSSNPPRCNGCHTGTNNPRNTPNGFAFLNNPPTAGDFEVFRTVARIDSGNESLVTVKARGGAGHAGGDLFPDGSNDADYVEFSNFVARARNCDVAPGTSTAKVVLGTGYEQLHRIVMTLGSRVPTQDEINLVATAGDQEAIDAALSAIIDGLMNEDAFIERVQEMYNDLLLTDKYNTFRNPLDENFDLDGWSNKDYYENNFSGDTRSDLRELGNYGISRAPMALIEYIITNNRPFTEILTADYMMVNPYSAVIYGVNAGDANFPFSSDRNQNNHDRDDFRRVSNVVQTSGDRAQLPIAGIVGTHSFLARYPSSFTNVNRKRASHVFNYFLGINIEGLAPRDGLDLDNVIGSVPTYEDPQCTVCHDIMDPIAGLFTKREYKGEYDTGNNYVHNQTTGGVPRMVPAGMSLDPGDVLPTANESQPLKWMVQRLAADDRFADKTVRTVLNGFTSIEASAPSTTAFINDTKVRFAASNYNFKALVKDIILSDYFRAQNLAPEESPNQYVDFGAGRTITAEELDRRIRAVVGGNYNWRGPDSNSGLDGLHYLLYGGIDSDDVTVRTTNPTSLMDGIQERIANQVSCERVANDLYNSGILFPIADETDTPDTTPGETAIRQNIVHLHRHLLGEDLGTSDAEVNATYQLFVDARDLGQTAIPSQCRGGGSSTDGNRTVLPWMAVVTYLMSDYRFLYQ